MRFWPTRKSTELAAPKPAAQFTVTVPAEMLEGMTGGGVLAPRISRAEALQVPAVLRSRNLIAGTLSTLPLHVRDSKKQPSPHTALFDQIDNNVPNAVTLAETYEDLLFEGVSWWRVEAFSFGGYPIKAYHVPISSVHVAGRGGMPSVQNITADLNFPANGQVYIDGAPVRDEEIIRFDSPNPPLLVHAARAIRTCLKLERTATVYSDSPMPQGVFTPEPGTVEPTKEEIQEILNEWETARKTKAWGYVGGGFKAQTLQWNATEIQLTERIQHAVLEIARATGIDPEDLGVSTTSRTYQNSEDRRRALIDFTLKPYIVAVEQRLSMHDVLPRGHEAKVNLDSFLRSDTKTRMEAYQVGKEVGAYTQDEIRDLEDRPALTAAEKAAIAPKETPRPSPSSNGTRPAVGANA